MYKLLIVDDEPLVQVGIKSMLNWADYNIEVIGTAVNGQIALNIIHEQNPDIIITDIKMPVMDGLELIRTVRNEYGSDFPDFIVLTSYEDFHMVKEAIRYHVTDYLVKVELTGEALASTVSRAIERLNKLRPVEEATGSELVEGLYDKFFIRLLNNLFESDEQFKSQAADLSLDFSYDKYICCYGMLNEDSVGKMELEKRLLLFSNSIQMVKELTNKYMPCYCIGLDAKHFALIFCLADCKTADSLSLEKKISQIVDSVSEAITNYYKVTFSYRIGRAVSDPLDIYESCKTAREKLKAETDSDETDSSDVGNRIVRNVKKYINEHTREKLTLNDVALTFNISPNYLSQLFSRFNDCGFSEYVSIRKVKESKKLIAEGNYKVYEVADMMGFESSFYFSKVFKKYEGISPSDYLNSL